MTIKILYPLDVGYRNCSQVAMVVVVDGRDNLKGQKVVIRCFDPTVIRPANLPAIKLPGTTPTPSSPIIPRKCRPTDSEIDNKSHQNLEYMDYRETEIQFAPRSSLFSSKFQKYPTFDDIN